MANGAQDCLSEATPAENWIDAVVKQYGKVKDICTLDIVYKSAATGPASTFLPKVMTRCHNKSTQNAHDCAGLVAMK